MYNIGTDIVEVSRIKSLIDKYNKKFLLKIFSKNEINYCLSRKNPATHFAGKFSAKEAIKKAISLKYKNQIFPFNEIEIINTKEGRPYLSSKLIKSSLIDLSIAHTDKIAVSFAILKND